MDQGDNSGPRTLSWVIEIEKCLNRELPPDAENRRTIDRVPSNLRGVHNNAFDPELLDIGPFNKPWEREGSSSRPRFMEEHKLRFLNRLLEEKLERHRRDENMRRTTEAKIVSNDRQCKEDDDGGRTAKAVLLDDLVEAMGTLEREIKACYSLNFDNEEYSCIDFVRMMVVDSCFVVELFRIYYDLLHGRIDWSAIKDDPIFTNPRILTTLRRDLLLLENQLPFFVLEKLYELINKKNNIDHQQAVPLEELAVTFFKQLFPRRYAASELDTGKPKAQHLLEVVHSTYLQMLSEKVHENPVKSRLYPKGSTSGLILHFVSELEEAGVQFKKRKGHSLLDIKFGHSTLQVPPLPINDHTISLLLNCVAHELTASHPQPIFTNYLMFWNSLVNSPVDVQILHNHGIVNNALGSNEDVANLLIRCREVLYDRDLGYLYSKIKELNEYCERYYENKYRVWWRSLIREHFSSPWTCLSLFAAIILLILTILQTIYTVYPYYRPH